MAWVSDHVLEAMGLERVDPPIEKAARFYGLHVFHVDRISIDPEFAEMCAGHISGNNYRVALGYSINKICKKLLGDDYADSEEEWAKEKKCSPPYAMIELGPTPEHIGEIKHIGKQGRSTLTYDAFPNARNELRTLAKSHLPAIVTALSAALRSLGEPAPSLVPIDKTGFGLTSTGETILDIRFEVSASALSVRQSLGSEIAEMLERVPAIAPQVPAKASKFFHMALSETDVLKKFLYFFLSIEVATHSTFSSINNDKHVEMLVKRASPAWFADLSLFQDIKKWPKLKDRFLWCAMGVWTHMTDKDVETFSSLKRIRDKLAHGDIDSPTDEHAQAAQSLAAKICAIDEFARG